MGWSGLLLGLLGIATLALTIERLGVMLEESVPSQWTYGLAAVHAALCLLTRGDVVGLGWHAAVGTLALEVITLLAMMGFGVWGGAFCLASSPSTGARRRGDGGALRVLALRASKSRPRHLRAAGPGGRGLRRESVGRHGRAAVGGLVSRIARGARGTRAAVRRGRGRRRIRRRGIPGR